MVDVRFEGLAKLSRYEWRKTVPVEQFLFYDEYRQQAREMTYLQYAEWRITKFPVFVLHLTQILDVSDLRFPV